MVPTSSPPAWRGIVSAAAEDAPSAEIEDSQGADIDARSDVSGGRSLAWTFQPMADGGTVLLVEDITERRNAEARINHLARFDELTGLPNRVSFQDEIERELPISQRSAGCRRCCSSTSISSNRSTTRSAIPPATSCCARSPRLREMLRPEDYVARFGGDEFVVFLRNIRSNEDAAILARRIVDRVSEPYKIDNHLVEIGASVGIAMTSPGISADTS